MAQDVKTRLASLLGAGVSGTQAAAAVGVTPAYVSQLLAEDQDFATKVAATRLEELQGATSRDRNYDSMEDKLLAKLEQALPLMFKPRDILSAISVINGAKRRGGSSYADGGELNAAEVLKLKMPPVMINQFILNSRSEVVELGGRELRTLTSADLQKLHLERIAALPAPKKVLSEVTVDDL